MELTVDRVGAKSRVSSPVASLDRRRIVAVRAASPACEKPSWLVPCTAGSGFAGKHSQRFTESGPSNTAWTWQTTYLAWTKSSSIARHSAYSSIGQDRRWATGTASPMAKAKAKRQRQGCASMSVGGDQRRASSAFLRVHICSHHRGVSQWGAARL